MTAVFESLTYQVTICAEYFRIHLVSYFLAGNALERNVTILVPRAAFYPRSILKVHPYKDVYEAGLIYRSVLFPKSATWRIETFSSGEMAEVQRNYEYRLSEDSGGARLFVGEGGGGVYVTLLENSRQVNL